MLSIAPVSVLLVGLFGMLVVAYAVTRMAVEERRLHGPATATPAPVGHTAPRAPQTARRAA